MKVTPDFAVNVSGHRLRRNKALGIHALGNEETMEYGVYAKLYMEEYVAAGEKLSRLMDLQDRGEEIARRAKHLAEEARVHGEKMEDLKVNGRAWKRREKVVAEIRAELDRLAEEHRDIVRQVEADG